MPDSNVLVIRTSCKTCAVPLTHVAEVMRSLPVEPLGGAPFGVSGMAVVRGRATPVVDLGKLLGDSAVTSMDAALFVTLRIGDRTVALLVQAVNNIRTLARNELESLPLLWQGDHPPVVAALATIDRELLLVLEASRLLPDDWLPASSEGGSR
jgi:purine-binding chemotaxis protein CheW